MIKSINVNDNNNNELQANDEHHRSSITLPLIVVEEEDDGDITRECRRLCNHTALVLYERDES